MFLNKEEKILVLLYRVQKEQENTLLGKYPSYSIGENKIRKLKNKIEKLGGTTELKIQIQ
jgi:hypothetical protein